MDQDLAYLLDPVVIVDPETNKPVKICRAEYIERTTGETSPDIDFVKRWVSGQKMTEAEEIRGNNFMKEVLKEIKKTEGKQKEKKLKKNKRIPTTGGPKGPKGQKKN